MEHRPPRFTTGMKTCLIAIYEAVKENLYWLILALAFALMLWLAPKVNATPLSKFLADHKLDFPSVVLQQMKEQDLVAAAGILNEQEKTFTVYFMRRPETEDVQEFEIYKSVMKCRFFLVQKKIIVEYEKYVLWNANEYKKVIAHLEFYPL